MTEIILVAQLLVAAGAAIEVLAPIPLDWQNRAAFHSFVAKLR